MEGGIRTRLSVEEECRAIATLAAAKDVLYFRGVSWETYQALLDVWSPRIRRHTYDHGDLEIMAPSSRHAILNALFGLLVFALFEETDCHFTAGGATTYCEEKLNRGIKPDQCYWLAEAAVLNLAASEVPTPDLYVEIELVPTIIGRIPVMAGLGIHEVWRFDGEDIQVGTLLPDGSYHCGVESPTVRQFPVSEIA